VPRLVKESGAPVLLGDLHFAGAWIEHKMNLPEILQMKRDGLVLGLSNSGDASNGGECLLWDAAEMIKAGMRPGEAARTLSIDAAKILGVDDVTGSLTEGKYADIAVYTGNPFITYKASAEFCLSQGRMASDKEVYHAAY
jgi:imidazolonepropionase-like amidohydrolase